MTGENIEKNEWRVKLWKNGTLQAKVMHQS